MESQNKMMQFQVEGNTKQWCVRKLFKNVFTQSYFSYIPTVMST